MGVGGAGADGDDMSGTAIPDDDITIKVLAASCFPRFKSSVCSSSSRILWFNAGVGALDQQ